MTSPEDTTDWTPVRIEAPLPLGVAGALMTLIGKAWPGSVIKTDGAERWALDLRLPPIAAVEVDEDLIADAGQRSAPEKTDADFLGFHEGEPDENGDNSAWIAFAPPEELQLHLGNIAHAIFTAHQPAAINHVEWDVRAGTGYDDPHYVLTIAKTKSQTPLGMHKQATADLEVAEKRIKALERRLARAGIDPQEVT